MSKFPGFALFSIAVRVDGESCGIVQLPQVPQRLDHLCIMGADGVAIAVEVIRVVWDVASDGDGITLICDSLANSRR